jgi:hypothetical protein
LHKIPKRLCKKMFKKLSNIFDQNVDPRNQSYDFLIYSYNASVVVGYSVFRSRIKYFFASKTR